mmetsp:Transcript_16733/g.28795  ORF Transcript_16733/g.28795 Transcript_16733/m.28795 type:complete len:308 (+) Transcript_16733:114-1037(+)
MKSSTRHAKKAAKARLSGAIPSTSAKNKKIVFGDDDDDSDGVDSVENEIQMKNDDLEDENDDGSNNDNDSGEVKNGESNSEDDDDDAVEEVKGSAARESTQRLRDAERETAKESTSKKKRKKKPNDVSPALNDESSNESSESEGEEEEEDLLTEDFFNMVDSERANQLQKAKQDKKIKRVQQKKRMGKHTTFVVEDEYKITGAPHKMDQNVEVIAIGGGEDSNENATTNENDERQILLSATLGTAPSKAAIAFARGGMKCGTSTERSSDSRKRRSKNEETWKRSKKLKKLGIGSRPGRAAALFVCNK